MRGRASGAMGWMDEENEDGAGDFYDGGMFMRESRVMRGREGVLKFVLFRVAAVLLGFVLAAVGLLLESRMESRMWCGDAREAKIALTKIRLSGLGTALEEFKIDAGAIRPMKRALMRSSKNRRIWASSNGRGRISKAGSKGCTKTPGAIPMVINTRRFADGVSRLISFRWGLMERFIPGTIWCFPRIQKP